MQSETCSICHHKFDLTKSEHQTDVKYKLTSSKAAMNQKSSGSCHT